MSGTPINLGNLETIEDGHAKGFDLFNEGRDQIFVIRHGDRLFAWYNHCPHKGYEGTTMSWKKDKYLTNKNANIFCAAHGAVFDIETGICSRGPCLGDTLIRADVRLNQSDMLWYPNENPPQTL